MMQQTLDKFSNLGELSVAQLVGFLVVEPTHPGLSPRLDTGARIFPRFILGFNGAILSVVGDVPVDSERRLW
jgi:hypothetical protein